MSLKTLNLKQMTIHFQDEKGKYDMQKRERKPLKENSNYTCYNKSLNNKKQGKKHRARLREQQSQKDFENGVEIVSLLSQGLFM